MTRQYYVYILTTCRNTALYTGVTNDLIRRVHQHRASSGESTFTRRYVVNKLVYYEVWLTALEAIAREKQIKAGPRTRKIALIQRVNPGWKDILASCTQAGPLIHPAKRTTI